MVSLKGHGGTCACKPLPQALKTTEAEACMQRWGQAPSTMLASCCKGSQDAILQRCLCLMHRKGTSSCGQKCTHSVRNPHWLLAAWHHSSTGLCQMLPERKC